MKRPPPPKGFLESIEEFFGTAASAATQTLNTMEQGTQRLQQASAAAAAAAAQKAAAVEDLGHAIQVKIETVRAVSRAAANTVSQARGLFDVPPKRVKVTRTK